MFPFTGLSTRQDGAIKTCYRSHPIGYIQEQSIEEIWNGKTICRIRQQLLSNERPPECEPCFSLEDIGVNSLRQRHLLKESPDSRINLYSDFLEKLNSDYTMPFEFPVIELKLNNLCNLKCRMCNPTDSTSWTDWKQIEEFYIKENNYLVENIKKLNLTEAALLNNYEDNTTWWENFNRLIPFLKKIEFAGGEPLIDPQHYRILDMLLPYSNHISLRYSTNLTSLGKGSNTIHKYWPKFKNVSVTISIDGIEESYEYIRSNASWANLIDNIKVIQQISNVSPIVGIVAVQVSNVLILDKMIEYFLNELGIIFYITNMVRYPNILSPQVIPQELKQIAVDRLNIVKLKIDLFKLTKSNSIIRELTISHINDVISFLLATDLSDKWSECVRFNHKLDLTRNQSFESVTPEFLSYIK